jgi:hypothetical protein
MAEIAFSPDELGKQEGGPGRTKIYRAIKEGKLRAHKDGKRTIILAADYIAYIQSLPLAGPPRHDDGAEAA